MSELSNKITYYATKYYEGEPVISDYEFDKLVEELRSVDPNNEVLHKVGWGYEINNPLIKEEYHWYDVAKFERKVRDISYITIPKNRAKISAKIDGGSICCYYEYGKLKYAITRGNGIKGYDVTDKMKFIVPTNLTDKSFTGLVRGEITMKLDTFNKKYSDYESVRNLSIGLIKRNKISLDELNDLDFVAYTVRGTTDLFIGSKSSVYNWLIMNNFNKVDEFDTSDWSNDGFRNLIKSYTKYLIDGIVLTDENYIKLDDGTWVPEQEVAYKTQSDTASVEVTDVTWNLTRTGLLYPRVWFTPVKLSGAVVSKATAFNAKFVKDNGIDKGAILTITRSGEVIPDVVSVDRPVSNPKLIDKCPYCGKELVWKGVHLSCENSDCSGRNTNAVYHWVTVIGGVKGLGSTIIHNYLDHFDIDTVDKLYEKIEYTKDHLSELDGVGSSTEGLLLEMISKLTSKVEFSTFLIACNLPMVGWTASSKLRDYKDLILSDEVDSNWWNKLESVKGVNSTGKLSIRRNIDSIRRYSKYVEIYVEKGTDEDTSSSTIVSLTGKLSVSRKKFLEEIKPYGYIEGPINKASYLITNTPNSGSNKNKKALELGVKVITEEDFRNMITTN